MYYASGDVRTLTPNVLFQDIWACYTAKEWIGLGDAGPPSTNNALQKTGGAGGMNGTANEAGLHLILSTFARYFTARGWEFVDLGAGDAVVLVASFAFGAEFAVGVEVKLEGQHYVIAAAKKVLLVPNGIDADRMHVDCGMSILQCSRLPTLQDGRSVKLPKGVFAFCDGWNELDRKHMFSLVGADPLVRVFICSYGNRAEDPYNTDERVLAALHEGNGCMPPFRCLEEGLSVNMYVSRQKKILHVFVRDGDA